MDSDLTDDTSAPSWFKDESSMALLLDRVLLRSFSVSEEPLGSSGISLLNAEFRLKSEN